MNSRRIGIVGGGAAGFFAALACAETQSGAEIFILEKTSQFLSKVKISGGGRCNVTHACFDEREFAARFPRGEQALIAPFKQFQARDTVAWFADRGVKLKTESDGRMFPVTDSSQTIIDCLLGAAHQAGVKLLTNCGVGGVTKMPDGRFELILSSGGARHSVRAAGLDANDGAHRSDAPCHRRHADVRLFASGHGRLPDARAGSTGGFARAHAGTAGAFTVHVSHRNARGCGSWRACRSKWSKSRFRKQNSTNAARCW